MMQGLMNAVSRHRVPLIVLAFVAAVVPATVAEPGNAGSRVTASVVVLIAAAVVFVVVVALSGRDPDAESRARDVAPDPLSAALFARWMRRSKHFRFVGGLSGAIVGLAFATGSLMPALIGLIAGIAVGGAAAEVHSLRRRPNAPRSADITVRHLGDYVTRTDTVALIVIGIAAAGLTAVAVVARSQERALVWTATAALAAVVAAGAMQWAVAIRRRPALSAGLRQAETI